MGKSLLIQLQSKAGNIRHANLAILQRVEMDAFAALSENSRKLFRVFLNDIACRPEQGLIREDISYQARCDGKKCG